MRIASVSLYVFSIIFFATSLWLGLQNGDTLVFDPKTNEKYCINEIALMFDLAVTDWRYKLLFLFSFLWLPIGFVAVFWALFRAGKHIRKAYNAKKSEHIAQ